MSKVFLDSKKIKLLQIIIFFFWRVCANFPVWFRVFTIQQLIIMRFFFLDLSDMGDPARNLPSCSKNHRDTRSPTSPWPRQDGGPAGVDMTTGFLNFQVHSLFKSQWGWRNSKAKHVPTASAMYCSTHAHSVRDLVDNNLGLHKNKQCCSPGTIIHRSWSNGSSVRSLEMQAPIEWSGTCTPTVCLHLSPRRPSQGTWK